MEALQRIRVFRVFDIFSLLGCLHSLRGGGLQQVCAAAPGLFDLFGLFSPCVSLPGEIFSSAGGLLHSLLTNPAAANYGTLGDGAVPISKIKMKAGIVVVVDMFFYN